MTAGEYCNREEKKRPKTNGFPAVLREHQGVKESKILRVMRC